MTLLVRHLTKNNLYLLFLLCVLFGMIYIVFNYAELSTHMQKVPLSVVIQYYAYNTPFILSMLFPLLFFLSLVVQCTLMLKNKELLALMSCGISIQKIFVIFFVYSIGLAIFSFVFTELTIITEKKARDIYNYEIRKRERREKTFNTIWFREKERVIYIGSLSSKTGKVENVIVYRYSPNMLSIQEQLHAKYGELKNHILSLSDVTQVLFTDRIMHKKENAELSFVMDANAIEVANTPIKELPLRDILRAILYLDGVGFDTSLLYSGIQIRITNALSLIIMGIMAIIIGVSIPNSYLAIGVSVLTAVIFFLSRQLLETLARLKIVNPSLAPWVLLLVWGIACVIIIYRKFIKK